MDDGGIHRRSSVENTNFALFVFIAVEGKVMSKGSGIGARFKADTLIARQP